MDGFINTHSYTDSPDVASIYAGTPGSTYSSNARYNEGANVFPVYLKMHNPLVLNGHQMRFGDVLRKLGLGTPNGITQDEVVKMLNHMINRKAGRVKGHGDFEYKLKDEDGEDIEEEGLDFSGRTPLHDIKDDIQDGFGLHSADTLHADTFAYIDTPRFKQAAERMGYDGVIHDDVMAGAEYAGKELLDKPLHELKGVHEVHDHLNGGRVPTHRTSRRSPAQVQEPAELRGRALQLGFIRGIAERVLQPVERVGGHRPKIPCYGPRRTQGAPWPAS